MQRARAFHLVQLPPDLCHAIADQPPVRLDLRFARTAEEAEAATLPLKVGPGANQAACLIIQMGQFDLQPALSSRRPLPEDFQDQAWSGRSPWRQTCSSSDFC